MARGRLILLVLLAIVAGLYWLQARSSAPPVIPGSVRFAPENPHRLQADEEGYYLPDSEFVVRGFQFNGFSLRPYASVIFSSLRDSVQHPAPCVGGAIRPDTVHMVCAYPRLGTVTIDGVLPIREVEDRSSGSRFSGIVVISDGGRTLYRRRHQFSFTTGD